MTKTTTVPHLLEQLSVELHANGVKFNTCTAYGIPVRLYVKFKTVGEKHDEAHVVVEQVKLINGRVLCGGGGVFVELMSGYDVFDLIPKSQVAAIEENLLAQMAGE